MALRKASAISGGAVQNSIWSRSWGWSSPSPPFRWGGIWAAASSVGHVYARMTDTRVGVPSWASAGMKDLRWGKFQSLGQNWRVEEQARWTEMLTFTGRGWHWRKSIIVKWMTPKRVRTPSLALVLYRALLRGYSSIFIDSKSSKKNSLFMMFLDAKCTCVLGSLKHSSLFVVVFVLILIQYREVSIFYAVHSVSCLTS